MFWRYECSAVPMPRERNALQPSAGQEYRKACPGISAMTRRIVLPSRFLSDRIASVIADAEMSVSHGRENLVRSACSIGENGVSMSPAYSAARVMIPIPAATARPWETV